MNQNCIFMSDFMLELSDGLQERLAFNISNSTTYFNDGNMGIIGSKVTVESALDFIGNMWNYLNSTSTKVSTAFFLKYRPVNLSGSNVRILGKTVINETFIMA